MTLRTEIECILRAILYPKTQISIVCKDETESSEYINNFNKIIQNHDILQPEIKDKNFNYISFKNGSYIKILKSNSEGVRSKGRRFEFI